MPIWLNARSPISAARDVFLFRHKINLTYQTDTPTLHSITEEIRSLLATHQNVLESPQRVRVVEYGNSAIMIDIYANISSPDINVFLEVQEHLLLAIRDIVHRNGSEFAYPTSTIHLAREEGKKPAPETDVENSRNPDTPASSEGKAGSREMPGGLSGERAGDT